MRGQTHPIWIFTLYSSLFITENQHKLGMRFTLAPPTFDGKDKEMRKTTIVLLLLSLLAALQLAAQPAYEPFIKFFKPLVGTWSCTINDYDETTGKSTWSEVQNREFISTLNGNYLHEKVYSPHFFEEKHVGSFIYSYEPASKTVFQTGFWVGTAGQLFEVQAQFVSPFVCKGKMKIKQEDGSTLENEVQWSWVSANEFKMTVFRKGKNGVYYKGEELIYSRKV
jgi:hypothetical protein